VRGHVAFPDGESSQAEYELEVVDDDQDIEALVEKGRFGRVTNFRRNLSHI